MKLRYALVTTIVLALAGVAHATECSGGSDGGMDATGNQCTQAPAATQAPAPAVAGQPAGATRSPASATRTPGKSERLARTRIARAR